MQTKAEKKTQSADLSELNIEIVKTKAVLEATLLGVREGKEKDIDIYACLLVIKEQLEKIDAVIKELE